MRCSYLAVRGLQKAEIYARLGFVEKGLSKPKVLEEYQGAELQGGWTLILAHPMDFASLERAQQLSADGALVIGTALTTVVMYSEAFAYEGGVQKWRIEHHPDSPVALKIEGDPPAELALVHAKLKAEQAAEEGNIDYIFDVPSALSAALHGFRDDEDGPDPQPIFYLLEPLRPQVESRGLFARIKAMFAKT